MPDDVVVVTGGMGLIGSRVCAEILRRGLTPVAVDKAGATTSSAERHNRYIVENIDVLDTSAMSDVLNRYRPSSVVHLAAIWGPLAEQRRWDTVRLNLLGTVSVAEVAQRCEIPKFVFASSRLVYGPVDAMHRHPTYAPVEESHPREPLSLYGKLKRAAEDILENYSASTGIEVLSLRFGSILGAWRSRPKDPPVSAVQLIESAIRNDHVPVVLGGDRRDHYCYVGDFASGVCSAIEAPVCEGRYLPCNIASDAFVSLREVCQALSALFPTWIPPSIGDGVDGGARALPYYFRLATQCAVEELGFEPQFDLRSAILDSRATYERAHARPN